MKNIKSYSGKLLRAALVCALLFAVLSVSILAAENQPRPMLSWTDNPENTQTVVWRSDFDTKSYVQYVSEQEYNQSAFANASQGEAFCKDISLDSSGAWHFEATMTNLEPATRYVYRVGNSQSWSAPSTFVTADHQTEAFSFVYMGDIQVARNMEEEYALWGSLALSAYEKAPDAAFFLLGGDIVESGISLAQFDAVMKNAAPVFSKIPVMPTNGNHESNFLGGKPKLYIDVFALPENGPEGFEEEFYSFDYGNAHILVVNSWVFSGEQQLNDADFLRLYNWIENDLKSSTATWKIVLTHLPLYPVHGDKAASAMSAAWAPLFERYGVSLYLVGHQHVYSRTYPMYSGAIDYEKGIIQIMGNAGQKFYGSADERFSERIIYDTATYQLFRIDGDVLTLQTFDINGNELDYFTLSPRTAELYYGDVKTSDWFYEAAEYVRKNALIDPQDGDKFAPNGLMTRQMLAEALYRLSGSPKVSAQSPFEDAKTDSVIWAYEAGVVNGMSAALFAPEESISREQIAAMLYRYFDYLEVSTDAAGEPLMFSDSAEISEWAVEAMRWANGVKLINGMGDGSVAPQSTATRAQVAQILFNMKGLI